ncbi:MAG TPA: response regulator [Thermoanaerobaculia bacterium]|nr:response regulator [Thermoanaerobaculia bacterium]
MSKRILLADDSVTIQKVVELTFLDEDFEVVAVSNGTQALARLEEGEPDLVIADVHMPGAGGLEVCRESKRLRPWIPVLLLVGTFEPFDPEEATAAGADAYLKKPFDSQELLRQAHELIAAGEAPVPVAEPEGLLRAVPAEPEPSFAWGSTLDDEPASTEVRPPDDLVPEAAPGAFTSPLSGLAFRDLAPEEPAGQLVAELPPAPPVYEPPAPLRIEAEPEAPAFDPVFAPAAPAAASATPAGLSEEDLDRLARRVVELLTPQIVREVAWEVVPDLAEVAVRARLRELEAELE